MEREKEIIPTLEQLREVADLGRDLIGPEGVIASKGPFERFFARDQYFALHTLVQAYRTYGYEYVPMEDIGKAAVSGLVHMNSDGLLAHEAGTREQGYPFKIDPHSGVGRHYGAVDVNALGIISLSDMYELFPNDSEMFECTLPAYIKMTQWSIKNIKEHKGMIGHTYQPEEGEIKGSREGTLQDGHLAILRDNGDMPEHPIGYVMEQAMYFVAMRGASEKLRFIDPKTSHEASEAADTLKETFNEKFVYDDEKWGFGLARAVDNKGVIHTKNIDELIALGFTFRGESILNKKHEKHAVGIAEDLVDKLKTPFGVLRTQGLDAPTVDGYEYHGKSSIWPILNGLAVQSMERMRNLPSVKNDKNKSERLHKCAMEIAKNTATLIVANKTPFETRHINDDGSIVPYVEFNGNGKKPFRNAEVQAWTVGIAAWLYAYLQANDVYELQL